MKVGVRLRRQAKCEEAGSRTSKRREGSEWCAANAIVHLLHADVGLFGALGHQVLKQLVQVSAEASLRVNPEHLEFC